MGSINYKLVYDIGPEIQAISERRAEMRNAEKAIEQAIDHYQNRVATYLNVRLEELNFGNRSCTARGIMHCVELKKHADSSRDLCVFCGNDNVDIY